eukprot:15472133-Alexandrium_andersonii.AAC.1
MCVALVCTALSALGTAPAVLLLAQLLALFTLGFALGSALGSGLALLALVWLCYWLWLGSATGSGLDLVWLSSRPLSAELPAPILLMAWCWGNVPGR